MAWISNGWEVNVFLLGVTLLLCAYFKVKSIYSYFERRGIPYVKPVFLLGSDVRGALARDCIGITFDRMYKALKGEKVGGCFFGTVPIVVVRDPEYVNKLFTTNFEHFHDRPFLIDEKVNPLEEHIFFLRGNKWRYLRNKLSPVFTSGKLKYMYDEMYKCSEALMEYMDNRADGKDIDLQETLASFSTDVIGSTAFGLEPESLKNPNSEFRAMGKKFFEISLRNSLIFALRFAFPKFLIAMKIHTTEKVISDYFRSIIKQVFEYRRNNSVTRKDFVQLSLQLKEKGFIEVDTGDLEEKELKENSTEKIIEKFDITDDLLAAQSFVFFLAGFETTSTTMYFLTYLLSIHKEVQDRAREEVRAIKQKYGKFSYDALKDLTYLENCISETLRIYPPVPMLNRECTKDYTFPNGTAVEEGTQIFIPIYSLQRDPSYFPDPLAFKPERFDKPPIRGTYAPFGDGPRICIGKRFALVEIKMTVAKLLDRYSFEPSPMTKTPVELASSITLNPLNPLYVKIKKLKQN